MTERPCAVCGATVLIRRSKAARAYTICNADRDTTACGSRVVYGARHSRELLGSDAPAARQEPTRAPSAPAGRKRTKGPARDTPTKGAPKAAHDGPKSEPSPRSSGFGLADW